MNAIELANKLGRIGTTPSAAQVNLVYDAADMLCRLHSENEALRKDAARYRFAKYHIGEDYELGGTSYYLSDNSSGWDKTIDKAMDQTK